MLKENELRIGNLIRANSKEFNKSYNGSIVPVDIDILIELISECLYDPIPLTPEVLEKCGFWKNSVNMWAIELWDMSTHLEMIDGAKGGFYPAIDQQQPEGSPQNVSLQFITHLHQLQNLYHALTGEELNYTQSTAKQP